MNEIIRKTYIKLMVVQFFGIVISAANSMIDTAITGIFLGSDVIAAVGLFSPVVTLIGVAYVFIIGFQILCSRAIGNGDSRKVTSLFSAETLFLALCGIVISCACLFFRDTLALILTAGRATETVTMLLKEYIHGYSYGITFQMLSGMMMVFLPLNNDTNRSYLSVAVMLVSNTVLDIASVALNLGAFGLGLATSISFMLSCLSVMPSFLDKYKAVHFETGSYSFSSLIDAAVLGLPSLMFTLGCMAKGYVMNMTLMQNLGTSAVAVMNVQGNICSVLGAVPMGCANAFLALGSIYYGEEDRESLLELARYALKTGVIISVSVMAAVMLSSYYISAIFFNPGEEAFNVSVQMLVLFPSFLVFNTVFGIFVKAFQLQGQTRLINILSLSDNIIMAVIAVLFTPLIGANAVWLAFPESEIICLAVIMLSVLMYAKKFTFSIQDWMELPETFGAKEGQFMEFTITSMEDVINISQKVIDFCMGQGISRRKSNTAGLAVEEMAGNTVMHGFRKDRKNYVDLRIVNKDVLTIRIRDNCPEFDPKKRLEQFSSDDPAANIGIKMIAGLSDEMIYQNTAGINTLMIKLKNT